MKCPKCGTEAVAGHEGSHAVLVCLTHGVLERVTPTDALRKRQKLCTPVLEPNRGTPKEVCFSHSFEYPPNANNFKKAVVMPPSKFHTARLVLSKEAREWKDRNQVCGPLVEGPVSLTIHVYRPRKRGDLDNCLKLVIDALVSGLILSDDDQVVAIHAYRHDDKDSPRVEVSIQEA